MRLFIEEKKGYTVIYDDVSRVAIKKIDNKNNLVIHYINKSMIDNVPLKDIKLAFLIDLETTREYFRYEK